MQVRLAGVAFAPMAELRGDAQQALARAREAVSRHNRPGEAAAGVRARDTDFRRRRGATLRPAAGAGRIGGRALRPGRTGRRECRPAGVGRLCLAGGASGARRWCRPGRSRPDRTRTPWPARQPARWWPASRGATAGAHLQSELMGRGQQLGMDLVGGLVKGAAAGGALAEAASNALDPAGWMDKALDGAINKFLGMGIDRLVADWKVDDSSSTGEWTAKRVYDAVVGEVKTHIQAVLKDSVLSGKLDPKSLDKVRSDLKENISASAPWSRHPRRPEGPLPLGRWRHHHRRGNGPGQRRTRRPRRRRRRDDQAQPRRRPDQDGQPDRPRQGQGPFRRGARRDRAGQGHRCPDRGGVARRHDGPQGKPEAVPTPKPPPAPPAAGEAPAQLLARSGRRSEATKDLFRATRPPAEGKCSSGRTTKARAAPMDKRFAPGQVRIR